MKKLPLFTLLVLAYGCANQTAPTGGPRDEDPPKLVNSIPVNRATNFNAQEIELEFDEDLKLNSVKEQIIISPRIDQEYEVKLRKNKVIMEFKEPLDSNTTYTINFREAIQDLNEGNSPENLKLAFSTGNYIDSLRIQGRLTHLLTDKPASDLSIFLYDASDTMEIFEDPPLYFTKADEEGQYLLENLKAGAYEIFAIADNNKDLKLSMKSERYGFVDSTLYLDTANLVRNIKVQYLDARPIEIRSARQNGTTFEVTYDKYLVDYQINTIDSTLYLISNFLDPEHRVITIYNNLPEAVDSTLLLINVTDTLYNQKTDSIYLKFEQTVRSPSDINLDFSLNAVFPTDGMVSGTVNLNKPALSQTLDSAYLYLDSLTIIKLDTPYLRPNINLTSFDLKYMIDQSLFEPQDDSAVPDTTLIPDKKPFIYFGKGAFIGPELDSTKTTSKKLAFDDLKNYGIMLIEVETEQEQFIVQLLNKNFEVVQEIRDQKEFSFNKVSPGDYIIRVLVDEDKNGRWDTGNIYDSKNAEPVYFYYNEDGNNVLTIRANWELGPNLIKF